MLTITTRLTFWYSASFGAIMIIVATVMYLGFSSSERETLDTELHDYAEFLLSDADVSTKTASELFDDLQEITSEMNLRFRAMRFMLTTRDSIIYDSTADSSVEQLVDSLRLMVATGSHERYRTIDVGESQYRAFRASIPGKRSEGMGIVVVATLGRLNATLARLRNLILVIVPLSLLAVGLGGWFLARRALEPVTAIRSAAAKIGSGNLHRRVPVGQSRDELSDLATTFNDMIERLEHTFQSQRRFVADASHDMRTPLMVVGSKLELVRRRDDLPESVASDLALCSSEIERMARTVDDLLLLARADAEQLRLVRSVERLDEIVVDCAARMRGPATERNISLWVDVADAVRVQCDATAIQRALTNVVENALKYSPPGTTVRIRTERSGDMAVVSIADEGVGIPAGDLAQVFDRFYRCDVSRSTPGSGLGLSIVKTIVEAHGGTVSVESAQGAGTTVTIALPAYDS